MVFVIPLPKIDMGIPSPRIFGILPPNPDTSPRDFENPLPSSFCFGRVVVVVVVVCVCVYVVVVVVGGKS